MWFNVIEFSERKLRKSTSKNKRIFKVEKKPINKWIEIKFQKKKRDLIVLAFERLIWYPLLRVHPTKFKCTPTRKGCPPMLPDIQVLCPSFVRPGPPDHQSAFRYGRGWRASAHDQNLRHSRTDDRRRRPSSSQSGRRGASSSRPQVKWPPFWDVIDPRWLGADFNCCCCCFCKVCSNFFFHI